MSENGEIYTAGRNFTLPPAVTALTNSTSVIDVTIFFLCSFKFLVEALASFSTSLSFAKVKVAKSSSRERGFVTLSRPVHFTVISSYRQTVWCTCNKKFRRPFFLPNYGVVLGLEKKGGGYHIDKRERGIDN